ncbi:MAG: hypothetical protein PHU71_04510 [Candidatus Gracilibacteria bacterium]|nr:hypothetical protein [Candidatus Gracilibacteria bacterium]
MQYSKLVIYTPLSHADKVREVLGEAGCGNLGKYDYCSFSVKGIGRFRPLKGSEPFLGKEGQIEEVEEERIEVLVETDKAGEIVEEICKVHPYEEPAIELYPLLHPYKYKS